MLEKLMEKFRSKPKMEETKMGIKFKTPDSYPAETPELIEARGKLAQAKEKLAQQQTPLATTTAKELHERNRLLTAEYEIRVGYGIGRIPGMKGGA